MTQPNPKLGFACAIGAQVLWGLFPLYVNEFKGKIEPLEIVAHRIIWSLVLLTGIYFLTQRRSETGRPKEDPSPKENPPPGSRLIGLGFVSASLIGVNWLTYVWAVSNERTLDASLGYYICPQVIILLSVVFLRERLGRLQWVAVGLAAVGVLVMTLSAASAPWVGALLAVAFGLYGLTKKMTSFSATGGLMLETGILVGPAIYLLVWRAGEGHAVVGDSVWINGLLLLTGVATVAPLALYAVAVKHLPFSTVGLLQFLGPTLQFLIAAFLFEEAFDFNRVLGFVFVWLGVGVFLVTLYLKARTEG